MTGLDNPWISDKNLNWTKKISREEVCVPPDKMASIRIESICCLIVENSTDVDSPNEAKKLSYVLYNAFCIVSASVSIIGSIYQIFPRSSPAQTPRNEGEQVSSQRQNYIINWLAVADMLASIGKFALFFLLELQFYQSKFTEILMLLMSSLYLTNVQESHGTR